ncbi:fructose-bisphosphate aldolase [Haematococcus lacustris]|uniref:fructose-bisphosphate aldolase n=1 Tax=Haematococcus lacustris TaxID=44745 RepID=A0A699ZF72_HAELA|nr:fructose-bisphosphate aldolase [Haematococcus lacustris]
MNRSEETLYQKAQSGQQFVDLLLAQGIYPGIKVDTGLQPLPGGRGETATQGLDGLLERAKAYKKQGARCGCSDNWCSHGRQGPAGVSRSSRGMQGL